VGAQGLRRGRLRPRPSLVAEAKGARDSAAGTQCVAPHNCEGEVQGHVRNGVSNMVRCSTGEPGKQVDDWLAEASVRFETKGGKVMASFLRRAVVFPILSLQRCCMAAPGLLRVCMSPDGAQGLTTVTSVSSVSAPK